MSRNTKSGFKYTSGTKNGIKKYKIHRAWKMIKTSMQKFWARAKRSSPFFMRCIFMSSKISNIIFKEYLEERSQTQHEMNEESSKLASVAKFLTPQPPDHSIITQQLQIIIQRVTHIHSQFHVNTQSEVKSRHRTHQARTAIKSII